PRGRVGSTPSRRTTERTAQRQRLLPDGHRAGRRNAMENAESNGTGAPDGSVLAYVDETGQYDHVLRTARTLAREHDARLILYHSVASEKPGESVRIPDAHAAGASSPQALSSNELRSASRPILAAAVEEARDDGIDAWGWLAPDPGVGPLMRYAEHVNAEVVVLPAELG